MSRIYDKKRWRRLRKYQLAINPLCAACGRPATDVDHIKPISAGGHAWDLDNLQSLCHQHHSIKTGCERHGREWAGEVGPDGLPRGGNHWWGGSVTEPVRGDIDDEAAVDADEFWF